MSREPRRETGSDEPVASAAAGESGDGPDLPGDPDRDAAAQAPTAESERDPHAPGIPLGEGLVEGEGGYLSSLLRRGSDDETLREQLREASAAAFRKVEESAPPSVASRLRALRNRIRTRPILDTTWRMMVFTLGVTLVVAGLIMFIIPGPGFATVILGLVVLGSEFTWATRALNPVKDAARRASEAAFDPRRRKRNLLLGGFAGVIVGLIALWYLYEFGLTIDPILLWLDDARDWVRDKVA